jgi:sugar lactone lactonase YvrE
MVVVHTASVLQLGPSEHAEGPVWDGRDQVLMWVDQYRGLIRRARKSPSGLFQELDPFAVGMAIGALAPSSDGGWVIAAGNGFHSLRRDGSMRLIADVLPNEPPLRRMNDGKADPVGRFWAGSMSYGKEFGEGGLYRLSGDTSELMIAGVTISNGLAWTPDASTMYYIDTPTRTVQAFSLDPHGLGVGEVVVRVPEGAGEPDGMCIDREGRLWVALWGGRAVHCYSPNGRLLEIVEVDAVQVSSCCFGGPLGSTLFITTSQEDYGEAEREQDPHAGMIFSVETTTSAPAAAEFSAKQPVTPERG